MNEWKTVPLTDLYEIGSGLSKPRSEFGFGHGFLTFKDVLDNFFVPDQLSALVNSTEKEQANCSVMRGDVFLTRTSETQPELGMSSVALKDYPKATFNGFTKRLRPKTPDAIVPEYAAYYFRGPRFRQSVTSMSSLSTRASLNNEMISRLSIVLPPVSEQKAIGIVLKALDDKIELNRRRNRTLEAMARAIFQSWFVDFDPVKAKAAGRTPPGLKPAIAALFPDRFEDSPLGPIPAGWRVTSLADEITANKGLSYKGDFLANPAEGLPMHNLNSVYEGGGYKHEGLKWYTGEYRPAHLLKPGDVIVTNTEQGFDYLLIGYSAIVPKRYGDKGLFSHHIYRIQAKDTSYLPTWFIYLLLRTPVFHELVAGHSNGTTVNMLPLDGLQKPRFVLPPEQLVRHFGKMFEPTQQQLEVLHDENVTIAALRDALLPKLISGELRVPDAERIVGRAT